MFTTLPLKPLPRCNSRTRDLSCEIVMAMSISEDPLSGFSGPTSNYGIVFFPHFPAETWHFCTILGPEGQTHYLGCTEANLGWTWLDRSNTSPGRKRLDNQTRPPTSAHQFQLRRGHGGPVLLEAKGQRRSENREETDHRNNSIRPNPMFVHVSSCF